MPIKVPNDLPAIDTLTKENVFVMTDTRAMTQDVRPLHILLLNLMPTKIDTETQLARLLGNTPLQIELELLQTATHKAHNVSQEHMIAFYKTFSEIQDEYFDGMIITGAPVEKMEFEEVDYWEELCEIMEWSKTTSTARSTSAGVPRPDCTTITVFRSTCCRRSCPACTCIIWIGSTACCSAALTMNSMYLILGIPPCTGKTSKRCRS